MAIERDAAIDEIEGEVRDPVETAPLLREIVVGGMPVATCLLTIAILSETDKITIAAGAVAGLVAVVAIARLWINQARGLTLWLRGLARGVAVDRPSIIAGSALEWLCWPALDLARRLRRAERRSRQDRETLEALVTGIPDPLLIVDAKLDIKLANPAATHLFGLAGTPAPLALATRDPGVLAAVAAALGAETTGTVVFSPVDARQKQFAVRVLPFARDGRGRTVLLAIREQTEQVMIERMRSDFVANASHEIRTPLAAIVGIIETLRGPAKDDAQAREMFLATMAEEAARMNRLVEDLLSLSSTELTVSRPPQTLVEPVHLLLEIQERMQPLASSADVALELDLPDELPPVVADADQMHQLLGNLIDNAIKYGGRGKTVRVAARLLGAAPAAAGAMSGRPALEIAVTDQGDGIAAEHLPRITERFYRVDKARSRRIGGTGLGLAIVKHIVRRHQGYLAVTSKLGEGSRFAVLLPLAASPR